ncbi:MAG: site-specific integrase [Rhodocyclales bacterium]|nr:site-specific integrase [Rhodocyclales bacterium]
MASIQERKSEDGTITYRVQVRKRGFPPQTATFERKTDAKRWAHDIESAINEGRFFRTTEDRRRTFSEMVEKYIKENLPDKKPQLQQDQKNHLAWWNLNLGRYLLVDVTPAVITDARNKLASEPIAPRTANPKKRGKARFRANATIVRYLGTLSVMYSTACREWAWVNDNPLRKVRKPPEPRGRVRFLSDDERRRLLDACQTSFNPVLYPVVVIALATGARSSEIMNLTWDRIDLERGRAILDDTKNGERRALHLTAHALNVVKGLSARRKDGEYLLFPGNKPGRPAELRKAWLDALKRAKIGNFRFHDLRHSAASYLAMNGATLAEIAEILGHKTLAMVKRYTHLSESHTRQVVTRMTENIFNISPKTKGAANDINATNALAERDVTS